MRNWLNIKNLGVILAISLLANTYFLATRDSQLEKNAFCAQFKEQAAKRISTYYTNGDVANVYPSEIFYSPLRKSCIAVWTDSEENLTGNGLNAHKIIFDAITNEELFSETQTVYFRATDNAEVAERNVEIDLRFSLLLEDLKERK